MAIQKVKILADGTIDLPPVMVKELNVGILPTQVMIEDRERPYRNYIDITSEEFFEKLLVAKELPTTSVPRQGDIFKVYSEALREYDSIIVIAHSKKISGSYSIAIKVAEMFPNDDITVIDSRTITIMEGLLVYEAAKLALAGACKEEIINKLHELIPSAHGIAIVKSLDHLRKGGRISFAKHIIANIANFKPIIAVEDGLVKSINKVKGFENGIEMIKNRIPEILKNRKSEFVIVLHAIMPEEAETLKEFILSQKENVPEKVEVISIGPVLGAHMGPYCLGLGWLGDWNASWWSK